VRISKYGILLTSLREEDIELVREKRNSDIIRSTMQYKEIITPEMQKEWFKSIDSALHKDQSPSFYFIIHYNNEKIGLINGKNIDLDSGSSEGGFFIWASEYWGTLIPVMTSIITLDYTFLINDYADNYIKVLKSNTNAAFYNKQLGYEISDRQSSDPESQYYILTKEKYLQKAEKFRKSIGSITNDYEPLSLANLDFDDTPDSELITIYNRLKPFQQELVKNILKIKKRDLHLF
jgi:RimJ/RimL family protein N-acetyltransferase